MKKHWSINWNKQPELPSAEMQSAIIAQMRAEHNTLTELNMPCHWNVSNLLRLSGDYSSWGLLFHFVQQGVLVASDNAPRGYYTLA